jgi:hypothetical protein
MFLAAAEKGVPLLDEATVAAIRAQVQAQYPSWNPDRMTMDYQPGDELFSRLLREAAGVDSFDRGRSESERQSAAGGAAPAGGGAGLLIAAAAAYFLLG